MPSEYHDEYNHELRETMRLAYQAIRGLAAGWPEGELDEPIADTLYRLAAMLADLGYTVAEV